MKVTTREFTRRFPSYRNAALAGNEVEVCDRNGNVFVFRAVKKEPVSVLQAMGNLVGSVQSGQHKKTLSGYGRD